MTGRGVEKLGRLVEDVCDSTWDEQGREKRTIGKLYDMPTKFMRGMYTYLCFNHG